MVQAEREYFEKIVAFFEKKDISGASQEESLAFYMNAYNVLCMKITLEHLKSPKFKGYLSFWSKFKTFYWTSIHVAGHHSTLYKLENDIIRGQFSEPRIHMCINCASWSCPRLSSSSFLFDGANLETQMEERTKDFINSQEGGVSVDPSHDVLKISEIFNWYKSDFEKKGKKLGIVGFIAQYHDQVQSDKKYKIEYYDYDWKLNASKM